MNKSFEEKKLDETLSIIENEYYYLGKKRVYLHYSSKERELAYVILPDEVHSISEKIELKDRPIVMGRCGFSVQNMDSYDCVRWQYDTLSYTFTKDKPKILVLNFANPVHPGGGVRKGAIAQEEDLCRKSTLLQSLESEKAKEYYDYNSKMHTYMGTDAVIISPNVEVIFDNNYNLLKEPVDVAVMTCAAPMVKRGFEGLSEEEYKQLLYKRIDGMIKVAIYYGYDHMILGAWGCGVFGNDAELISDLYYKALKELKIDRYIVKDFFRRIDFAVLDRSKNLYNYTAFARNFEHFYRDEDAEEECRCKDIEKKKEIHLDAIRGCIFGGAVGDALGYPVEFDTLNVIQDKYGDNGITEYLLDEVVGKALISDDTQMTLFTANGILIGETRHSLRGIGANPSTYVEYCYKDWLKTQQRRASSENDEGRDSWLAGIPELYSRRAPGNTCISVISSGKFGSVEEHINDSKGCGGVMRVAPLGAHYEGVDDKDLALEGAQIAALTHGHSLGYMPAATLTTIVNQAVYHKDEYESLEEIIVNAKRITDEVFAGDKHLKELDAIIDKAIYLAGNSLPDNENIRSLGEGWVAEETLAIAIYCAIRYQDDFSKAVIAAVNHDGDSDSTGSVTGNIVGAWLGFDAIDYKWKKNLELSDIILEIADDICYGCNMSEYSSYEDEAWKTKYIRMLPYKK